MVKKRIKRGKKRNKKRITGEGFKVITKTL